MQSLGGRERMHHNLDRRTVEALLRLQALLPGTLIRRARVRRILVDEAAGGPRREHVEWQESRSKSEWEEGGKKKLRNFGRNF